MSTQQIIWTRQEFLAYLLLYAAHADTQYDDSEKAYILSKIEYPVYKKIWKEFVLDNDYQHLKKILAFQEINPTITAESIMNELYELFLSDNHFHRMEKYMLSSIRQLFS